MTHCACGLTFKDADLHLVHQASEALSATFAHVDKVRAIGQDSVPMSELVEVALDARALHTALVPGIDYNKEG